MARRSLWSRFWHIFFQELAVCLFVVVSCSIFFCLFYKATFEWCVAVLPCRWLAERLGGHLRNCRVCSRHSVLDPPGEVGRDGLGRFSRDVLKFLVKASVAVVRDGTSRIVMGVLRELYVHCCSELFFVFCVGTLCVVFYSIKQTGIFVRLVQTMV